MQTPDPDAVRELLDFRPAGAVLSVFVAIDPADRSGGWRIALQDELKRALEPLREGDQGRAAEATSEHVLARFSTDPPPAGRGHVGFVGVTEADHERSERWFSMQKPPRQTQVYRGSRPALRPLVELLDDGRRLGVVAIDHEHARFLEWELGEIREVDSEEIMHTGDWRERKAPRPTGPAPSGTSAAGKDQHDQRLDAGHKRFAHEMARRADALRKSREWRQVIVFGENEQLERLLEELGSEDVTRVQADVVGEQPAGIAARVEELLPGLNRERELRIVERAANATYAGNRGGARGPQEALEALAEGRVEHLVFDADRGYRGEELERALSYAEADRDAEDGLPLAELLIERALRTGAGVTPVEGEAAEALAAHDGVAAILRY